MCVIHEIGHCFFFCKQYHKISGTIEQDEQIFIHVHNKFYVESKLHIITSLICVISCNFFKSDEKASDEANRMNQIHLMFVLFIDLFTRTVTGTQFTIQSNPT